MTPQEIIATRNQARDLWEQANVGMEGLLKQSTHLEANQLERIEEQEEEMNLAMTAGEEHLTKFSAIRQALDGDTDEDQALERNETERAEPAETTDSE